MNNFHLVIDIFKIYLKTYIIQYQFYLSIFLYMYIYKQLISYVFQLSFILMKTFTRTLLCLNYVCLIVEPKVKLDLLIC